jgi:hypothetical protein
LDHKILFCSNKIVFPLYDGNGMFSLPGKDQGRAQQAGGLVTIEDWFGKVAQGDPEA